MFTRKLLQICDERLTFDLNAHMAKSFRVDCFNVNVLRIVQFQSKQTIVMNLGVVESREGIQILKIPRFSEGEEIV